MSQCSDFLDRVQLLTQKLLKQGYVAHRLKWQLKNGYCGDDGWLLRNMYQMTMDLFPFLCSITDKTFTWLHYMSDTAGILSETGTAYPSRSPRFTSCICYFFIWFFVLFVIVMFLVCPILLVSLDCPFLIAPSVFSNVYLHPKCRTSLCFRVASIITMFMCIRISCAKICRLEIETDPMLLLLYYICIWLS